MKSKEIWQRPCPLLIRSIAMEGGIGPVAGSSHHSIYQRMPGVKVISPMTPDEYQYAYDQFMKDDDVFYISEHRKSYDNSEELENIIHDEADVTLFPISITRFAAQEAARNLEEKGIKVNVIHQLWIKPFDFKKEWQQTLSSSKYGGIVLDDDYEEGAASSIAHRMMMVVDKKVRTFCLRHRTAGFHPTVDNLPPNASQIEQRILEIIC
jgi:pyruvate/2-oxoglutarate/acetoin dehydrogenase E1 component